MAAEVLAKAQLMAKAISPARVASLTGTLADLQSPDYLRIKEQFIQVRAGYPRCRFIYLLGTRGQQVVILADSEAPSSPDYSSPGQVYTEAHAAIINACQTGKEAFVPPYQDRWGVWVTALAPIRDFQSGRLFASLAMDFDAKTWGRQARQHQIAPILATSLIAVILVFFFVLLRRSDRALSAILASETALRESRERYRIVADYIYDWEYWHAPDESLSYVSPSCERITGYPAEAFLRDPSLLLGVVHPDDKEQLRCHFDDVQHNHSDAPCTIDMRIVTRSGETRWISHACQRVYGEDGAYLGRRVSNRDITDRKQAENALQESEQRVRAKLDSILTPDRDIGLLELRDLVDMAALQLLMDDFTRITGFGMALIDMHGNVLVAAGWQDVCTRFHRLHPDTHANCIESDTVLATGVVPGAYKRYRCKNGLWDMVTPLVVGESHVGNIFLGQFRLSDEGLDYETLRANARKYGFDEKAYVEAFERVPQRDQAAVDAAMEFCRRLCDAISKSSHANIKLARAVTEHERLLESLRGNETLLNLAQEMAGVGGWEYDIDKQRISWTDEVYRIHEIPRAEIGPVSEDYVAQSLACYDEAVRPLIRNAFQRCVEKGEPYDLQAPFMTAKGRQLWVRTKAYAVLADGRISKVVGTLMDITGRRQAEDYLKSALDDAKARERQVSALLQASRAVIASPTFEAAAREIFDICRAATGAASGYVALLSDDGQENEVLFLESGGLPCDVDSSLPMPIRGLRGIAYETGKPVYDNNFATSEWMAFMPPGHVALQNVLFAPLNLRGKVMGLVGLANKPTGFTDNDAAMAGALAETVALALQRAHDADALRESERRYRQLFESMTAGFALHEIILDAEGVPCNYRFLEVNPAFERLVGVKAETLVGRTVLEALPATEPWWIETYGRVATTGQSVRFQNYASGMDRFFEVSAYSPQPGQFATVFQDITESERAKEALVDSETRYRRLFEAAKEGIMTLDAVTGAVIDVNPALVQMFGLPAENFLRRLVWDIDASRPLIEDEAAFERLRQGDGVRRDNVTLETGDGRRIVVEFTSNTYQAGQQTVIQCTIRDMTESCQAQAERARLEEQLRQAQKMEAVGQLAGGVAHDFNNLLQVILGYVDIVLADLGPGHKDARILGDVRKAAERAADLTRQLLAFSRRQVIQPVNLDLNALVSGVLTMIRRVIGEHIELRFLPGQHLGTVRADKGQIEQILMNLCVNARDAMPAGGRLSIETSPVLISEEYSQTHAYTRTGPHVLITVTDTGCGMDDQTRSQIFEPFFTTKEMGQGTGLGLATVYGIVQQHNGWIHVYSEIGSGTVFRIYLPAIDEAPEDIAAESEMPIVGGTETILVAEDEDMVRNLVVQMLVSAGYTVLAARDGEEAMRLFEEHESEIALALLDVMMPKLGGRQVMDRIQSRNSRIRFLFSSGYSENAIHTGFVIKEGLHLITKPYRRVELLKILRVVLDAPEA